MRSIELTEGKYPSCVHSGEFSVFIGNIDEAYQETELDLWDSYQSGPAPLAKTISAFSFGDILA